MKGRTDGDDEAGHRNHEEWPNYRNHRLARMADGRRSRATCLVRAGSHRVRAGRRCDLSRRGAAASDTRHRDCERS